ncbi:hypothetical protein ACP4OV_002531 [Aristida adscensionis]
MEMKVSSPSSARSSKKRPPSRLQKQAPASLQLEQGAAAGPAPAPGPAAWGEGTTPIPLLSPLVTSPAVPVWEADQAGARRPAEGGAAQGGGGGGQGGGEQQLRAAAARLGGAAPTPSPAAGAGWRHPALPAPLPEPASLGPMFQSQCAVEVRNARQ